jgi:coproporphyrinogen III oxidase
MEPQKKTDQENRLKLAAEFFRELQDKICSGLRQVENQCKFKEDLWVREGGGGGRTRIIEDGEIFEKGGVNFSEVSGTLAPEFASQLPGGGRAFAATGISLVLHPRSPMVPTVHANFRYLAMGQRSWFGGGADLTPYYPYREDVINFHRTWKEVCHRNSGIVDHASLKKACDEYFYLPHRAEPRGVGGIFFDYLESDWHATFAFVQSCGEAFLRSYLPIVHKRAREPYTHEQRQFQEFRRGRYVEFNLLYDRGTAFGLKTGGRIESILMSLPPIVRWRYDARPEKGSREAELYDVFLKPHDWAEEPLPSEAAID